MWPLYHHIYHIYDLFIFIHSYIHIWYTQRLNSSGFCHSVLFHQKKTAKAFVFSRHWLFEKEKWKLCRKKKHQNRETWKGLPSFHLAYVLQHLLHIADKLHHLTRTLQRPFPVTSFGGAWRLEIHGSLPVRGKNRFQPPRDVWRIDTPKKDGLKEKKNVFFFASIFGLSFWGPQFLKFQGG